MRSLCFCVVIGNQAFISIFGDFYCGTAFLRRSEEGRKGCCLISIQISRVIVVYSNFRSVYSELIGFIMLLACALRKLALQVQSLFATSPMIYKIYLHYKEEVKKGGETLPKRCGGSKSTPTKRAYISHKQKLTKLYCTVQNTTKYSAIELLQRIST